MTRYIVFSNPGNFSKSFEAGTPENVACEIASVLDWDDVPASNFRACLENTPEATLEILKSPPIFSICLDQERIEKWNEFLMPLHERMQNVINALRQACALVYESTNDLVDHCKQDENFKNINRIGREDLECAFELIQAPDGSMFSELVEEVYAVNRYQETNN